MKRFSLSWIKDSKGEKPTRFELHIYEVLLLKSDIFCVMSVRRQGDILEKMAEKQTFEGDGNKKIKKY